jgi:hypothetical protein
MGYCIDIRKMAVRLMGQGVVCVCDVLMVEMGCVLK